ncbi:hypothetical protein KQI68_00330 [Peptoniphilus sp. MSJ-1]|uniref:Dicarboxylate carrier MatC N-terminal domain-containing protein n=1 Tax=Peptoniphilus ovalis TaxID=2841503 RepID=A0ABS6FDN8_9FIRM|nr:SLC13 family permease [Peptoniphilus ovalis]MBU5668277.1 hypothetical protein [Peptoniphilus ovalis]
MLAIVTFVALLVAIVTGFLRNINVGIASIGLAFIVATILGVSVKEIMSGFNSSLFLTMLGVSYLFGIINSNKTLETLAKKLISLTGGRVYLIPPTIFIIAGLMTFAGPGSIPLLAIMPIISIPIALNCGYNPIMLSLIGVSGAMACRMSPITPEGILVHELLANQGINDAVVPVFINMFIAGLIDAIAVFIFYKGYKVRGKIDLPKETFTRDQVISTIALVLMVIGGLVFKLNIGLLSFFLGFVLIVIGVCDEKTALKSIPWNVLLMVVGVGILMKLIFISGGIDLMVDGLSKLMTTKTAAPIMLCLGSLMSFFSSGLGVVFPTLIPTVSGIVSNLAGNVSPIELASMVVIGGTISGVSPISTAGALILSGVSSNEEATQLHPENKMFVELFGWAIATLALSLIVCVIGVYSFVSFNF